MRESNNRFTVVERFNGYELLDTETGKTAWLGDGVDALSDDDGNGVQCGTEAFRLEWQAALNQSAGETFEAYFGR